MSALTPRALATLVLLAAWLGAAVLTAAVVAPAAFAVLPTRALAGALVGRVLPALFIAGVLVGAVAAALQWTAPGPLRGARAALPLVVAAACAAARFGVAPRIERVRAAIGPSVEALAPTDERRVAFGRLHGVSVALLGAATLAAAGALAATALAARGRGARRPRARPRPVHSVSRPATPPPPGAPGRPAAHPLNA